MSSTKEGWVEENSGGVRWTKQYLVLQNNFLLIFSKPPGGLHKPRTKLDVTTHYLIDRDTTRQNTFVLCPKDKNKKGTSFAAPDSLTAQEWISAIRTQQTPLPTPTAAGPAQNPYMKASASPSGGGAADNPYMPQQSQQKEVSAVPRRLQSPSSSFSSVPLSSSTSSSSPAPLSSSPSSSSSSATSYPSLYSVSPASPSSLATSFAVPAPQDIYPSALGLSSSSHATSYATAPPASPVIPPSSYFMPMYQQPPPHQPYFASGQPPLQASASYPTMPTPQQQQPYHQQQYYQQHHQQPHDNKRITTMQWQAAGCPMAGDPPVPVWPGHPHHPHATPHVGAFPQHHSSPALLSSGGPPISYPAYPSVPTAHPGGTPPVHHPHPQQHYG